MLRRPTAAGGETADGDAPRVRIQRATEQSMDDGAALKSAQAMARIDAQHALARARVLQLEAGLARNAAGKDFTERVRVELVDATPPKSMIGVGLGEVDEALAHHLAIDPAKATLVTFVMDELPAKTAGIERFDVIVAINGDANASPTALRDVLKDIEPGAMIAFDVRRGADVKKIEVAAVVFDPTKMAAIDPQSFDFDMREVSGFELPNGAMAFEDRGGEMDGEMEPGAVGEENVVIFMGPDGKPRELRMPNFPRVPELPTIPHAAAQSRPLNGPQDDDRIRRLEEQMERLLRELEKMNERNAAAPTR
ncbi:MAG: PDZ domain-containing protein [Planctomycetota bacterium]|nr:MAG: PDZ domain-containing protein [Planctomycetota bacterium]